MPRANNLPCPAPKPQPRDTEGRKQGLVAEAKAALPKQMQGRAGKAETAPCPLCALSEKHSAPWQHPAAPPACASTAMGCCSGEISCRLFISIFQSDTTCCCWIRRFFRFASRIIAGLMMISAASGWPPSGCTAQTPSPSTSAAWIPLLLPSHHTVSLLFPPSLAQPPFPWTFAGKCSLPPSLCFTP